MGYDARNGTSLCYENECLDAGFRNSVFVNIYVGDRNSNCFPMLTPFGATSICNMALTEVFIATEINRVNMNAQLAAATVSDYSTTYLSKLFRLDSSTIRVRNRMKNENKKLIY
jgi:hypothetical protein